MRVNTLKERIESSFVSGKALLMEAIVGNIYDADYDILLMDGEKLGQYVKYTEFLFNLSHKDNNNVNNMTEREIFRAFIT